MNKKDYEDYLEELINSYESEEILEVSERIIRLEKVIKFGKEYNSKYKNPYRHYFMGKPILYTDRLLNHLEKIMKDYEKINYGKKIK